MTQETDPIRSRPISTRHPKFCWPWDDEVETAISLGDTILFQVELDQHLTSTYFSLTPQQSEAIRKLREKEDRP